MAGGEKPAISIAIKPVGAKERTYLMAGWVGKDGRVSSLSLDKKILRAKFELEGGATVLVTRGADGKLSHYIDIFDNRAKTTPAQDTSFDPGDDPW